MSVFRILLLGVVAVVAYFGFQYYDNAWERQAIRNYDNAVIAMASQDYPTAVSLLVEVYRKDTEVAAPARSSLKEITSEDFVAQLSPEASFALITEMGRHGEHFPQTQTLAQQLLERSLEAEPVVAKKVLDLLRRQTVSDSELRERYEQENYRLLGVLVEQQPAVPAYAIELAALEEERSDCAPCEALLAPHKDQLGSSNAARILGQIYAARGEAELAFPLLFAYVEPRLKTYHARAQDYDRLTELTWNTMIDFLNSPRAPQAFIDKYEAAPTQEAKDELLNGFYVQRLESSIEVQSARRQYQEAAAIVPVALDLGIVMLNRAASMTDPAQRQEQLEAAEQTFLAIRDDAGDSDNFQYYLGQVYYWLGKDEEGKALFDSLLAKYERSGTVLYSLSDVLRDLGAHGAAKDLAEEGYNKAAEVEEQQAFAQQMALLSNDLDEKIEWTEKANPSDQMVRADLLTLKGHKAAEASDNDKALSLYGESIAAYLKMPESSSVHNNVALVYMARYRLSKNDEDYEAALASLDKAIALEPDDSIILTNSIAYHLNKAYRDLLANHVDLKQLDMEPSLSLFSYVYRNEAEKQKIISLLQAHPSMEKALSYTRKALLLAPKDMSLLRQSMSLYRFLRMDDDLATLAAKVQATEFDLRSEQLEVERFRSGASREETEVSAAEFRKRSTAKLPTLAEDSVTAAILRSQLLAVDMSMTEMNYEANSSAALLAAERNLKAHSSARTADDYTEALLLSIITDLRNQSTAFENFFNAYNPVLGKEVLLAIAIGEVPEASELISGHPNFKIWLSMVDADVKNFPSYANLEGWYLLRQLGHSYVETLADALRRNPSHRLLTQSGAKLAANREGATMVDYMSLLAAGQTGQARRLLSTAATQELQLPESLWAGVKSVAGQGATPRH